MRDEAAVHARPAATLAAACLGLLLGTAWQLQQARLWSAASYQDVLWLALAGALLARLLRRAGLWRVAVLALALALLGFGGTGWRAARFGAQALDPALQGRDLLVRGTVSDLPHRNEAGLRFRFESQAAWLDGQPVRLPQRLELTWYAPRSGDGAAEGDAGDAARPPGLRPGETWQFAVRLKVPHGAVNPHGFDAELWQWEQGVQASGYVRAGRHDVPPQRLGASAGYPVAWARQQLRERIDRQIGDARAAGLIAALVAGDQNAIERADWDVFRLTGVAHLMSISGLHITMFGWLAARLLGGLWRRSPALCQRLPAPSAALLGGVLLALLYAVFSGWGVPARRTVLMFASVAVLRLAGLRWPWPQVWLLTCAVVVASDPWALWQAGFWLSFVAVGVLFASADGAAGVTGWRSHLLRMWREQWVVTVALAPLSLVLFGQVSLVGLLANALAIPWVTLLVTPLAMLGALLPACWELAAQAVLWMMSVLDALAHWPLAVLTLAQAPWWTALAGVAGGLLLTLRLPLAMRVSGLPLMLPVLLWPVALPPPGQFELLAADVGQGSAVLVRTANHALLFDAGPRLGLDNDAGQRVLVPLLRALDVQADMLILSHRDNDHAGGARAVLRAQPDAVLLTSIEDDPALRALREPQRCQAGQRWRWDGVDFELLHPQPQDYASVRKTNAMSCVLRIGNGQRAALLVGDIEVAQERQLLQRLDAGTLRADVLLVPHHGSRSSSSAAFLDAVQPRFALVQAGYRNRYGHPDGTVLVRYAERSGTVIDTPHCGAASWQSWRADSVRCQRQQQPHYWRHF